VKDCVYCVGTFVTLYPVWHDPGNLTVHVLGLMLLSISTFSIELHYFSSRSF
jgi:hypothetical protein